MLAFVRGEHDCLVATTIIESGLDIPNANTLIVERADQLGLAQAYQIRGRVGRSRERAYAYLLYPSAEALTADAAARLATLSDNTELGSGFRVAMRDLEIRGAGNLLGDEQSGHVAAVGFELYCQMLEDAAEALRAGAEERRRTRSRARAGARRAWTSTPTCRPTTSPSRRRRSTSTAASPPPGSRGELRALREELEDRFGPVPEPVANLLDLQRARIELGDAGARTVEFRAGPAARLAARARLRAGRGAARAAPGGDLPVARADGRGPGPGRAGRAPRRAAGARRRARRGHRIAGARRGLSADLDGDGYAAAPVNADSSSKRERGDRLRRRARDHRRDRGGRRRRRPPERALATTSRWSTTPASTSRAWSRTGTISKANFDRCPAPAAKQSGAQTVPAAERSAVRAAQGPGVQTDLQIAWLVGEAEQAGPRGHRHARSQQSLQQIKPAASRPTGRVPAGADQAGLTEADVLERAKLQLIQTKIQENIQNSAGRSRTSDAERPSTTPTRRSSSSRRSGPSGSSRTRTPTRSTRPTRRFDADNSAANWKKVAAQFSTDPTSKDKGGLRTDVVTGLLPAAARRRRSSRPRPARFRGRSRPPPASTSSR